MDSRVDACPLLASLRDATTFHTYPSPANGCTRFDPPARLPGSYQSRFCLNARHVECPLVSPSWSGPFPPELRAGAEREWGRRPRATRRRWGLVALLAFSLVAAAVAAVWFWSGGILPQAPAAPGGAMPPAAIPPLLTQPPSPTPPPTETPAPSLTPTPMGTETQPTSSTPTAGPALETPIGTAPSFLIHVVRDGDSLNFLAQVNGTTEAAIQAVNGLGKLPLWIGQMLVIPVGIGDPAGLPKFTVVQVAEPGETLAALAARLGSDPAAIHRYNVLGKDAWLPPGRWLIVPTP